MGMYDDAVEYQAEAHRNGDVLSQIGFGAGKAIQAIRPDLVQERTQGTAPVPHSLHVVPIRGTLAVYLGGKETGESRVTYK